MQGPRVQAGIRTCAGHHQGRCERIGPHAEPLLHVRDFRHPRKCRLGGIEERERSNSHGDSECHGEESLEHGEPAILIHLQSLSRPNRDERGPVL